MCLPAPDIRNMMSAEQRRKWATQLGQSGNTEGARWAVEKDRFVSDLQKQITANEATLAKQKLTPDQADEVMRKTGTSPIPQPVTGKGSRRNAFIDGPAGIKSLLGGK